MTAYSSPASLRTYLAHTAQAAAHPTAEAEEPVLTPAEALWVMVGMAALTLVVWAI